jgi:hypothetical protein
LSNSDHCPCPAGTPENKPGVETLGLFSVVPPGLGQAKYPE